jgi:hypothetical protein
MAAMALLLRARAAEKSTERDSEELVRDPYVLRSGGLKRLHCSTAGNWRTVHQAVVLVIEGLRA